MKSGTQVALAVAAGYLLGRRRKMKLALMLGGAMATGGLGGVGGQLLRRGGKLIGSSDVLGKLSPELGEVTGLIGGELVPVGKAAARAAVTSRINALSDQIHERAEALRVPAEAGADEEEDVSGDGRRAGPGDEEERPARARRREPDEELHDEELADEEPEPRAPARRRRAPAGAARRAGSDGGDSDEDVPVRAAGRAARSAGSRTGAPVRRTRR